MFIIEVPGNLINKENQYNECDNNNRHIGIK